MTSMVVEMTSLQGIMGEITPSSAARRQPWARRSASSICPGPRAMTRRFAARPGAGAGGQARQPDRPLRRARHPHRQRRPFGLRRAALGIVNSLIATETRFSVRAGLAAAAALQPIPVSDEALQETATFVTRRLEGVLGDLGYAFDVVEAVLAVRGDDPVAAVAACRALADAVAQPAWGETFTAYARTARITRQLEEQLALNPAAYVEGVEQQLHDACVTAAAAMHAASEPADLLWPTLRDLREPINAYFEAVLVNAEDATLRAARLALLQQIAALPAPVADLSKLQGF
jgi:glycyl-tRNA synthetase